MEKDLSPITKKSSTRWDPSTYVSDWVQVFRLLRDEEFFINIIRAINLPKDASILEIGIGSCKWSAAFAFMGYKVTAMDNSPEILKQAQINFPNIKIEYVLDELPNLKSEASKRKYEVVFNEGVLEHFLDKKERIAAIRSMRTCCIDGGYVFFYVPFLSDKEDEHRYVSVKEISEEVVDAGLKPVFIDIINIDISNGKGGPAVRSSMQLRIVGKKE